MRITINVQRYYDEFDSYKKFFIVRYQYFFYFNVKQTLNNTV